MNLGASSSNYGAMDDEDKVVLTKYSEYSHFKYIYLICVSINHTLVL